MNPSALREVRDLTRLLSSRSFAAVEDEALTLALNRVPLSERQQAGLRQLTQSGKALEEFTLNVPEDDRIVEASAFAWHPRKVHGLPRFNVRALCAADTLSTAFDPYPFPDAGDPQGRSRRLRIETYCPVPRGEYRLLRLVPKPLELRSNTVLLVHEPAELGGQTLVALLGSVASANAKVVFIRDRSSGYWRRIAATADWIAQQLELGTGDSVSPFAQQDHSPGRPARGYWTFAWWRDVSAHPNPEYWGRLAAAANRRADRLSRPGRSS